MFINCDLGECGVQIDALIMPKIDMANIACGGHIGDVDSMTSAVKLAKQHQVLIGAHPSYEDRNNFGRISIDVSLVLLSKQITSQINTLIKICDTQNMPLTYVKPHGALYHDILKDKALFEVMLNCIKQTNLSLFLVVQAECVDKELQALASQYGVPLFYEAFADRAYNENMTLVSRTHKNAVFETPDAILKQFKRLHHEQNMQIDTICFHSDNPASLLALEQLH